MKADAYCSRLNRLFSTPAWLTLIRSTAMIRSSGVRKRAVAGESGKKNLRNGGAHVNFSTQIGDTLCRGAHQNSTDTMRVMMPVMVMIMVDEGRRCRWFRVNRVLCRGPHGWHVIVSNKNCGATMIALLGMSF